MSISTVRFADVAGTLETDINSLRWFIELWFNPEDIVVIQKLSDNRDRQFLALPARDLYENAELILAQHSVSGVRNDFYYGVNPVQHEISSWSKTRRQAGLGNIKGFFVDLDVKPGAFDSKADILEYLKTVAIRPTTVVESGSGGIHATWKASGQIEPEDLKAWWAYLQSLAPDGVNIDRLVNVDRIFRLPGSVRWSKTGASTSTVKLIDGCNESHSVEEFRKLSKTAYNGYRKHLKIIKAQKTVMLDRQFNSASQDRPGYVKAICESRADELDWAEILEPAGWTFQRENSDGSRQWIRPGSSQKSAVTDYTHSDGSVSGVMSLLSSSPDSGLLDLKEVGIPLTKFHVLLRLRFADDLDALITNFTNKEN